MNTLANLAGTETDRWVAAQVAKANGTSFRATLSQVREVMNDLDLDRLAYNSETRSWSIYRDTAQALVHHLTNN